MWHRDGDAGGGPGAARLKTRELRRNQQRRQIKEKESRRVR